MRRVRYVLSTTALVVAPLSLVTTQVVTAQAAIPHAASPSATMTSAPVANGVLLTVTGSDLANQVNTFTIKVTCSGTHSVATECYNPPVTPLGNEYTRNYFGDVTTLSTSAVQEGSTYSMSSTVSSYYTTSFLKSLYMQGLVNGQAYSATVKLNSGSASTPVTTLP